MTFMAIIAVALVVAILIVFIAAAITGLTYWVSGPERKEESEGIAAQHEKELESLRMRCMAYVKERLLIDQRFGIDSGGCARWLDVQYVPLRVAEEEMIE